MNDPRGIALAGAIALAVTAGHGAYRAWPSMHGVEMFLAGDISRPPINTGLVSVRLRVEQIALDTPHPTQADMRRYELVRRTGDWWLANGERGANARRLRGRPLYIQLAPGPALWPGGPAEMRASTVSNALVPGAINLAGIATSVNDDGYITLDFALGPVAVPSHAAADAAAVAVAILRVLPSGRATLAGVIVNGTRY